MLAEQGSQPSGACIDQVWLGESRNPRTIYWLLPGPLLARRSLISLYSVPPMAARRTPDTRDWTPRHEVMTARSAKPRFVALINCLLALGDGRPRTELALAAARDNAGASTSSHDESLPKSMADRHRAS